MTGRHQYRVDDALIAGAAAQVTGERFPDFWFLGVRMVAQEGDNGHEDSWRTESTLQRMRFVKRLLNGMELAIAAKALDGRNLMAIGLHRQHQARPDGLSIEVHRTCTADAVLTSDVGSSELQVLTQEVAQEQARFYEALTRLPVDGDRDGGSPCVVQAPGAPELN